LHRGEFLLIPASSIKPVSLEYREFRPKSSPRPKPFNR
jgi:hypothetical protein